MGQTMTSKILARAAGKDIVKPGDVVIARIALFTQIDGTTFIDNFQNKRLKLWDPRRVIFCFDHFFQPDWIPQAASREHPKIKAFAKEQGVPDENIYGLGRNGISHQVPVERGWALPGTVCVGADGQSATMGAANCLALPALFGVDPILLTGDVWMEAPEVINIRLSGAFRHGVTGKDFVYRLIADLGEHVNGRMIEFSGPGVASLSIDARMAIANGSVQLNALSMMFPYDDVLASYLKKRAREPFEGVQPDEDAIYSETLDYDLSTIEELVAGPHDIELIRPLSDLLGQRIDAANIGSCSGGRLEDLALAAEILHGRKIHPSVRMVVTPISAETARDAARDGIVEVLLEAGATFTQPGCGACYSGNLSPLKLDDGERCISSSVETLRGRMGSKNSEVLLANPAVVAASAIEGRVADPSNYLRDSAAARKEPA